MQYPTQFPPRPRRRQRRQGWAARVGTFGSAPRNTMVRLVYSYKGKWRFAVVDTVLLLQGIPALPTKKKKRVTGPGPGAVPTSCDAGL